MKNKFNYLAGANTSCGFVSKFNEILDKNKKGFTFVLKGGPGTGKSTFIKKVAKHFEEKGNTIENYFCSSDCDSLDGVRIVEKNVCIVDGTAPHEQDANLPWVNGRVIDLGACVGESVKKHKSQIEKLIIKKNDCFKNAYSYLRICGEIISNFAKEKIIEKNKIKNEKMFLSYFTKKCKNGGMRTVFFEFFNKKGKQSLEDINDFEKMFIALSDKQVNVLKEKLIDDNNYFIEVKSVFNNKTLGFVLEDKNLFIKTNSSVLDLENQKLVLEFCEKIGNCLEMAKLYHKEIEKFYVKNLDFKMIDELIEKTIFEIEKIK